MRDPISSSRSPQRDHDWLEYVQRDIKVRNFLSSSRGAPMWQCLTAKNNAQHWESYAKADTTWESSKKYHHHSRALPIQLPVDIELNHREGYAKRQCKVSQCKTLLWSLLQHSSLPLARLSTVSLKKRRALVMMTTERLRTVSGKSASRCIVVKW
jgi:hypothetical protein